MLKRYLILLSLLFIVGCNRSDRNDASNASLPAPTTQSQTGVDHTLDGTATPSPQPTSPPPTTQLPTSTATTMPPTLESPSPTPTATQVPATAATCTNSVPSLSFEPKRILFNVRFPTGSGDSDWMLQYGEGQWTLVATSFAPQYGLSRRVSIDDEHVVFTDRNGVHHVYNATTDSWFTVNVPTEFKIRFGPFNDELVFYSAPPAPRQDVTIRRLNLKTAELGPEEIRTVPEKTDELEGPNAEKIELGITTADFETTLVRQFIPSDTDDRPSQAVLLWDMVTGTELALFRDIHLFQSLSWSILVNWNQSGTCAITLTEPQSGDASTIDLVRISVEEPSLSVVATFEELVLLEGRARPSITQLTAAPDFAHAFVLSVAGDYGYEFVHQLSVVDLDAGTILDLDVGPTFAADWYDNEHLVVTTLGEDELVHFQLVNIISGAQETIFTFDGEMSDYIPYRIIGAFRTGDGD